MTEQPKKRSNPFDRPITPIVEDVEEIIPEETVQQPVNPTPATHTQYTEPVPQYNYQQPVRQTTRTQRQPQRQQYVEPQRIQKEKYTATMDYALRRRIKIYCATYGKMFSDFIEEACREKLGREEIK